MNKKGLTMIELLLTIAILAGLTVSLAFGARDFIKKGKEKQYNTFIEIVEAAAVTYVNINKLRDDCDNTSNCVVEVSISALVAGGYLSPTLDNPEEGGHINQSHIVYVTWVNNERTVEYSPEQ